MGCPCTTDNPATYLSCAGDQVRLIAPQSVLTQYAAQAGASSSNWTMCVTVAFLAARRMEYWKNAPGDCGSATRLQVTGIAIAGRGIGAAAAVDPEPISKGILAGVAAIFGGFTAHHAQAVATEQQTGCNVMLSFNSAVAQLEQYVSSGQISAVQASTILANAYSQLVPQLQSIAKGQNLAWGYLIAMAALKNYFNDIVFPALETVAQGNLSATPAPLPPLPQQSSNVFNPPAFNPTGLRPTNQPGSAYVPPPATNLPLGSGSVGTYTGSSGFVPQQMNGNNIGTGPTSPLTGVITPGTIVLIGGVAFVASRIGAAS